LLPYYARAAKRSQPERKKRGKDGKVMAFFPSEGDARIAPVADRHQPGPKQVGDSRSYPAIYFGARTAFFSFPTRPDEAF
jgi:hypothetical protein